MLRILVIISLVALAIASCSNPVIPIGPIRFIQTNLQCERIELRTIDSTARFDRVRTLFKDSVLLFGVLVDSVTFNGVRLPLLDSGDGEYGIDSARIASMVTGKQQVFRIDPHGDVPILVDSVRFPVELVAISPQVGATFSKRQGIPVTWTPANDSGSSVVIDVSETPDRFFAFLGGTTPDDGAHTIEPRFLANENVGRVYVFIARLRSTTKKAGGDRNYNITASSVTAIEIELVE